MTDNADPSAVFRIKKRKLSLGETSFCADSTNLHTPCPTSELDSLKRKMALIQDKLQKATERAVDAELGSAMAAYRKGKLEERVEQLEARLQNAKDTITERVGRNDRLNEYNDASVGTQIDLSGQIRTLRSERHKLEKKASILQREGIQLRNQLELSETTAAALKEGHDDAKTRLWDLQEKYAAMSVENYELQATAESLEKKIYEMAAQKEGTARHLEKLAKRMRKN